MNMKKWTTPIAMEECFTANVDVAVSVSACYKVACDADEANKYEEGNPQLWGIYPPNHTGARCTFYENNVIKIDSKTHKIISMKGKYYKYYDAECQFTTPDYQQHIDPGVLKVGDRVYWTHKDLLTYHHQGYLRLTDPNKKCMS